MKYAYLYRTLFLIFSSFWGFMPVATAQSWAWGAANTGVSCEGWAIAADGLGNVYGGGFNQDPDSAIHLGSITLPAYTTTEDYQSFWVKYNAAGVLQWAGCTTSGATCIASMATDPAGNLIILGSFTSHTMQMGSYTLTNLYTDGTAQYFLAKLNSAGAIMWAVNDGSAVPEAGVQYGMLGMGKVCTDDTGNIYITSSFKKATINIGTQTLHNNGPVGSYDLFVAKYTGAGTPVWASSIGGNNNDYAMGLAIASTGKVYVSGMFSSSAVTVGTAVISDPSTTTPRAFIAQFSPSGMPAWARSVVTAGASWSAGLVCDNSDDVYMSGSFYGPSVSLGSTVAGRAFPLSGSSAAFLVKFNTTDSVGWARTLDGAYWGAINYSLAWSPCAGKVWLSAYASGDVLGGTGDTIGTPATGADPIIIAAFNTAGAAAGFSSLSSGGDDEAELACDAAGDVYICADIDGTTLDVGAHVLAGIPSGEIFYVAKYANTALAPDTVSVTTDTTAVCNLAGTMLTATPGFVSYYWYDNSTGPTHTIYASGQYYVYCISCSQVQVDTFNVVITMDSVYTHTDTIACNISDTSNIALIAPPGIGYLWYDGVADSAHSEHFAGSYWVTYISGCNMVTDTFNLSFTNSSPPCPIGVSVHNTVPREAVVFYPNPAFDELVIETEGATYTSFTITNGLGQVYIRRPLASGQTKVGISSLPPGLYYFTFTGDGGSMVRKFVKI